MKLDTRKDGGRHVRSVRKQAQRNKAKANSGALPRRRANKEAGKHLLSKKESPVRKRRHKLAAAVRIDIVDNGVGNDDYGRWPHGLMPTVSL